MPPLQSNHDHDAFFFFALPVVYTPGKEQILTRPEDSHHYPMTARANLKVTSGSPAALCPISSFLISMICSILSPPGYVFFCSVCRLTMGAIS